MQRIQSATELAGQETRPVSSSPQPKRARTDDEKPKLSKEEKAAKKARKESKALEEGKAALLETLESSTSVRAPEQQSVSEFLAANEITIHDPAAPPPCMLLSEAPFPKPLVDLLMKQGFSTPSAVQAAAWPLAASGRDVLAVAKTGSGKTLGYLLPALARCHTGWEKAAGKPLCLVMAPTRELALQIKDEATKFGAPLGVRAVAVYGGAPKWGQTAELQRGCEIIIATPGRMMDMLDLHGVSYTGAATTLDLCELLVLDEADRMLDMGFEKDILAICDVIPQARQTLFFTATWPKAVQRVAGDLLGPTQCKVSVGSGSEKLTANKAVTQNVQVVTPGEKWNAFLELIAPFKPGGEKDGTRVIIFANTKKDVNGIGQYCWDEKFAVDTLSGDRTQRERESVIQRFKSGQVSMVIATDVAARGLDISGIQMVINYDYPPGDGGSEDFIHRIGRTGRAGATGAASTLFTFADSKHARELVRILTDAEQPVSPELAEMAANSRGGGGGKGRSGKGGGKGKGKGGKGGGKGRW